MRTLIDERLIGEANRFGFRFACEDCAHILTPDSTENEPRCSLGYPAAPLLDALHQTHLEFCKCFELG